MASSSVVGGSKWSADTRFTEIMLDIWRVCGLGQQNDDCSGCATMREI